MNVHSPSKSRFFGKRPDGSGGVKPNRSLLLRSISLMAICVLGWSPLSGCRCLGPTSTCLRPNGPVLRAGRELRRGHLARNHGRSRIVGPEHYLTPGSSPDHYSGQGHEPYFNQHPNFRFLPVPGRDIFQPPRSYSPQAQRSAGPQLQSHPNDLPPGQYSVPPGKSTGQPNFVPGQSNGSHSTGTQPGTRIPGRPISTLQQPRGTDPAESLPNIRMNGVRTPAGAVDLTPPPGYGENDQDRGGDRSTFHRPPGPRTVVATTHNQLLKHPFRSKANQQVSGWVHNKPVEVPVIDQPVQLQNSQTAPLRLNTDSPNTGRPGQVLENSPRARQTQPENLNYQTSTGSSQNDSANQTLAGRSLANQNFATIDLNQPGARLEQQNPHRIAVTGGPHYQTVQFRDSRDFVNDVSEFQKKKSHPDSVKPTNQPNRPGSVELPKIWPGAADPQIASSGSKRYVEIHRVDYGPKTHVVQVGQNLVDIQRQQNLARAGQKTYGMFPYYPVTASSHQMYETYVPTVDSQGVRQIASRRSQNSHTGIITR